MMRKHRKGIKKTVRKGQVKKPASPFTRKKPLPLERRRMLESKLGGLKRQLEASIQMPGELGGHNAQIRTFISAVTSLDFKAASERLEKMPYSLRRGESGLTALNLIIEHHPSEMVRRKAATIRRTLMP